MSWYVEDLVRKKNEREKIGKLAASVDWLTLVGWRLDNELRLVLDADILVGPQTYAITLQFPEFFPDTPPSVFPRGNDKPKWSSHQFGAGGELCLEYGPDTWMPEYTGCDVIENAHKLLSLENPATGAAVAVASRHSVTPGQKIRNTNWRFFLTLSFSKFAQGIPAGTQLNGELAALSRTNGATYHISSVTDEDGTVWTDPSVPEVIRGEGRRSSLPIFVLPENIALPADATLSGFKTEFEKSGFSVEETSFFLVVQTGTVRLYLPHKEKDALYLIDNVVEPEPHNRLDPSHLSLEKRSVAIIGCGSLGSKIATMLARSGVGRFVLVDDDLLLPENLVRNDLDWRDVASNKADALSRRIKLVRPHAKVERSRTKVGGQESNSSAEALLKLIGDCDLVMDATADPNVLNVLSAVVKAKSKLLIWAEIFGGGFGGLIARYRPGIEPIPQHMRRTIDDWFKDNGPAPKRSRRKYETGEDGPPLIADDTDVSVIAAHAGRFAVDLLINRSPSLFPHSVYAIGMGVGSVFKAPFETYPIVVGPSPAPTETKQLTDAEVQEEAKELVAMFVALKAK